jgi:autotransporter translocation and assembly factor TamB
MSVARRSLQVVAFICTLIVGVTSMAVIVTQTTWFKEWLRGFIVRQAEDYVNGKLSIGRLDGNVFSGIELGDIEIKQNGRNVVSVGEVGLQYKPFTFIKGDVVLDHIRLDRPQLYVERTAQGWNITQLIKAKTPSKPSNRTLEIGEIGISDGSLDIHDAVGTSGVDVPSRIDRLDASVAVKSGQDALQVDVAHVSFRAQDPRIGVNAMSGTIRQSKHRVDFDNVSLRTEESSMRVNGSVTSLETVNPVVDVTLSSDKLAVQEIGRVVPALRGYQLQPAFELTAKGPSDALAVKLNARDASLGQATADLTVDATDPRRRVAGTVSLQHFNVGPLARSATLKSDVTGQARVDLALPAEGRPLSGTYKVNAGQVAIAGYEARNVVADGRIDGDTIRVNGSAAAYGGHATARGIVKTGPQLALDLSGHASNLDLRNLPAQMKAPGIASNLQFDYTVNGRGQVFAGDVTLATSTLAGATIAQGTTAHFNVGAGAPSYAARGQVANLDVQQVGRGFGITALAADRYRSTINASFDVRGSGGGTYPLTLDATGTATDSEMFGAAFPRLDFTTSLAAGNAHVKAEGEFAHLDPAVLSGNDKVGGSLNGAIDVDTTIRNYAAGVTPDSIDAAGHMTLTPSTIAGVGIDSAALDGQFADRVGTINDLSIKGADLTVTGQGPLVLDDTGNSNVELHIETPSLAKVGKIAGQDNLTGGAVVDATISGNAQKLTLWGNVHGSNIGEGENNALALDSTFDVTVPNLDASAMTAHAQTTGTFVQLAGQKINGVYADTTYGNQLLQFSLDAKQEQRQLDAGGEVIFHPDHQEIHLPELILRSQQVEWRTPAGSKAAIQYAKDHIAVEHFELDSPGGQRIVADGVLGGSAAEPLRVQAENVDVASLNQIALGQPGDVAGRLTANATLSGPTSAPRVAGDFTLAQGAFRNFRFDSLAGKVDYAERGVNLDVKLQQNATQSLTAKGYAPMTLFQPTPTELRDTHTAPAPGEAVDLQVQSSPIDLSLVEGFTSYVTGVTGTMQANVKVTGSGYDPHLDGAIEVHNGSFQVPDLGTSYTGLDTRIDLTPEAVKIAEMKIVDNHGSAMTVGGQLAVHGRELGGVEVTMQATDFKVIDNKMGNLRLDTNLRLTGEVRKPRLEGSIDVNTGWLDVAEILAQATSDAYSTKATELPTEEPLTAEAKVRQNAAIPADAEAKRPGAGADTAPNTTAVATRNDQAEQAATTVATAAVPPLFDGLDLDVSFGVPSDLVLKGQDLKASGGGVSAGDINVTVGGAIRVWKVPFDVVRLTGEVDTVRGSYTFQGRRFDIQRDGRIRFIGSDPIDPMLDLEAHRTIQAVEAIVQVRGTMRQPELSFRSSPPLEEADVLSLIVFNQPINELGEGQQASLAQRAGDLAGGYLASGLARSIGNALNLNEFELQAAGENGLGPSVSVGQQVGKNLFFRFRQAFGSAQATELILEYQLADFLRLQATAAETSGGAQRIQFRRVERGGLDLIFFFSY